MTLLGGVDPEIEVHPDPNWPERGPFKGFEGSRELVNSWLVAWGTAGRVDIDEFRDLGERFIVRARFNLAGAGSGAEVEMATSCVAELEDDIAVKAHFFFDHGEALKLAGVDGEAPE